MRPPVSLNLLPDGPLIDGPILSCSPDHLRMCSVLKSGGTYYLYGDYIRAGSPFAPGSYDSELHLFTSRDLLQWKRCGPVITRRPGQPDAFGCVNVDVLVWQGRVHVYYLGLAGPRSPALFPGTSAPFGWLADPDDPLYLRSTLMVAVSDSPEGPFDERHALLEPGPPGSWESHKLVDPHVCFLNGRFHLYYKGFSRGRDFSTRRIGLAVAEQPTGPYIRHSANPVVSIDGGCEVPAVFSRGGICGMILVGFRPHRNLLLGSADGVEWSVLKDPFIESPRGRVLDVGLVKDEKNELQPYFFQVWNTNPADLAVHRLWF